MVHLSAYATLMCICLCAGYAGHDGTELSSSRCDLAQVNSETDFVARNAQFTGLVSQITQAALRQTPLDAGTPGSESRKPLASSADHAAPSPLRTSCVAACLSSSSAAGHQARTPGDTCLVPSAGAG